MVKRHAQVKFKDPLWNNQWYLVSNNHSFVSFHTNVKVFEIWLGRLLASQLRVVNTILLLSNNLFTKLGRFAKRLRYGCPRDVSVETRHHW